MSVKTKKPDASTVVLRVDKLQKFYGGGRSFLRRAQPLLRAVDGVSFTISRGETLGLVGESGCGKTTTGRCVPRLVDPTSGDVYYRLSDREVSVADAPKETLAAVRNEVQVVFQDPFSSLDQRMLVQEIVGEPLRLNRKVTGSELRDRVAEQLDLVGLSPDMMSRYPHEFSGGQRQRIGIARALILEPRLLVCDEPVSALDVSVQAQVLNLLLELQESLDLTYLFIAHDLSVVDYVSDRIAVMYLGKIVELSNADDLYRSPRHPYTEALLGSIPAGATAGRRSRRVLAGSVPDPTDPPSGCAFRTRCPYAQSVCAEETPELLPVDDRGHRSACHFSETLSLAGYSQNHG